MVHPVVGARINYSGLQFKDGTLAVQEYHHLHADLLWNVLGGSYSRQEQVRWHLAPFAGIGLLHHATNGHNPFAVSYGIQGSTGFPKGKRPRGTLRRNHFPRFRRVW